MQYGKADETFAANQRDKSEERSHFPHLCIPLNHFFFARSGIHQTLLYAAFNSLSAESIVMGEKGVIFYWVSKLNEIIEKSEMY